MASRLFGRPELYLPSGPILYWEGGLVQETAMVGAGGTIGFVQPFADLLTGAPCILMGVSDPNTQAHSANESLHLGDWV